MKRLAGVGAVIVGLGLVSLGLLFMMGAAGRGSRYAIAVIGLALGGVLAGVGVRLFKQAEAASPEQLRAEILALAKQRSGEVSEADVEAALGRRAVGAAAVLAALEGDGRCSRHRSKDGAEYFVFAELQPRMVVKRCEFCKAELPLGQELTQCPHCGGTFKTDVETRSMAGEDAYGMDE